MTLDFDPLGKLLVVHGFNVAGAILVAFVGWWAAGVVERLSRRALVRVAHTDGTVAGFLSSFARYAVLVVADEAAELVGGERTLGAVIGGFILIVQYFVILPPFAWLAKRVERRESPGWTSICPQPNRSLQRQY